MYKCHYLTLLAFEGILNPMDRSPKPLSYWFQWPVLSPHFMELLRGLRQRWTHISFFLQFLSRNLILITLSMLLLVHHTLLRHHAGSWSSLSLHLHQDSYPLTFGVRDLFIVGGWFYELQDVWWHLWPIPTSYQEHPTLLPWSTVAAPNVSRHH